jgi:hypothetical protein
MSRSESWKDAGGSELRTMAKTVLEMHGFEEEHFDRMEKDAAWSQNITKASGDSFTVGELREALPEDIFEAVVNQLDLDDGPAESMEEVGKSAGLAEELYNEDYTFEKGSVGASHHLGNPVDEGEVEVSKSSPALDRFYESQGVE